MTFISNMDVPKTSSQSTSSANQSSGGNNALDDLFNFGAPTTIITNTNYN
jgi:hypothetical protein